MTHEVADPKVRDAIVDYIVRTRSWKNGEYSISYKEGEGTIDLYWIAHQDDLKATNPGGGISFVVRYDTIERKVVGELQLQ